MVEIDEETARNATAYHEAGHAVVAMHCGWWISPDGVELRAEGAGYTGHRVSWNALERDNPRVVVSLAGFCAERRWRLAEEERRFGSDDFVCPEWDDEICAADDYEIAIAHLEGLHQELDSRGILELLQKYEDEAKNLVEMVWPAIERLARRLLRKGKLSAIEAHKVAGYPQPGYLAESDEVAA